MTLTTSRFHSWPTTSTWRQRRSVVFRSAAVCLLCLLVSICLAPARAGNAGDPPGAKDWMNSPLVGGGVVPDGETEVFFSAYLDRVLSLDEQKYVFDVSIYVFLSWIDARAPSEVAKATNETTAEGGRDCARLCIGQRAPSEQAQCCDSLWLPSFVIRNADEMPQGRLQPYYITVDPATGVVTWRVEFRSNFYTSLDVQAFPFDSQRLEILLQYVNLDPKQSRVKVTPSARGLHLFSLGWGDDLSSFRTKSLLLEVWNTAFSKQFNRNTKLTNSSDPAFDPKAVDQVAAASNPRDPAPLVPSPLAVANGTAAPAFGEDLEVVNVIIIIVLERLWQYFIISAVVPVLTATLLSFVVFAVPPNKIDTRLQTATGLFLSLIAIQFVIEGDLPKSSYVIPTRMLVLASYVCLGLIAIESLVVFNIWNWPEVRSRLEGRRAAVRRAREMTKLRMAMGGRSSRRSNSFSRRGTKGSASDGENVGTREERERGWANQLMASIVARRRSFALGGGSEVGVGGGITGSSRGGVANDNGDGDGYEDDESSRDRRSLAGGGRRGGGGAGTDSSAGDRAGAAAAAAGSNGPLPLPLSPKNAAAAAPRSSFATVGGLRTTASGASPPSGSGGNALFLEKEEEQALWHWRAWRADVVSFYVIGSLYLLVAVLIFACSVLAARRNAANFTYAT